MVQLDSGIHVDDPYYFMFNGSLLSLFKIMYNLAIETLYRGNKLTLYSGNKLELGKFVCW